MTTASIRPSELGIPTFKPWDHQDAEAIVFEPLSCRVSRRNGRPCREVVARVSVFASEDDVDNGEPSTVFDRTVVLGRIASLLEKALPEHRPVIGYIERGEVTEHGTHPWELADLDDESLELLDDWLMERAR